MTAGLSAPSSSLSVSAVYHYALSLLSKDHRQQSWLPWWYSRPTFNVKGNFAASLVERNSLSDAAILTDERKICEHSCHATGWYIFAEEKILAGLSSVVGRQTEGREEVEDKEYAIIRGGEGNVLEKIWELCKSLEVISRDEEKKKTEEERCLSNGEIWWPQYRQHFLPKQSHT